MQFALFSGREAVAKQVVRAFPAQRIGKQMAKDGKLPDELSRTRSWHYSLFALEAATKLATLAECVGENLWTAKSSDGKSIGLAFAYLAPYQISLAQWPHKESGLVDPAKQDGLHRVAMAPFRMMAWGTGEVAYDQLAGLHPLKPDVDDDYWLPAMPQPAQK